MSSLSLARIMYGTNEDTHASHSMNASALSAHTSRSVQENSANAINVSEHATLGQLLHKVWTILTGKP